MSEPRNASPQPRQIADDHVDALIELDPIMGTHLGDGASHARLPDFSPAGQEELADLFRSTLRRLPPAGTESPDERNCARLLRERLTAELAMIETGEQLRAVSNIFSPVPQIRTVLTVTPTGTDEDWLALAGRLRAVPESLAGYRAALAEGLVRNLPGGPRQVAALIRQLDDSIGEKGGWFADLVAPGPEALRTELAGAAGVATDALVHLRDWLRDAYAPAVEGAANVVGEERYVRSARYFNGIELDLAEAYDYGWSEFHRLLSEMRVEAAKILPGSENPWAVLEHLETHGHAVDGTEAVQRWLQDLMDEAIEKLDGTHFDMAERVKRVESCIAPAGASPAPYYTSPSLDFTRPGRTWLPTAGRTRFPTYELVSTWYHEGVPGHHLQLAQWAHLAGSLSRFQTGVGMVSANAEGWALYAERLMDELGFLGNPEHRLGYLDAQMMRAVRVVIDIGMHLELEIPAHSPFRPGERWNPDLAEEFFGLHSGRPAAFIRNELIRYQSVPGQAIGYKLGERAWLRGRDAARKAGGSAFDLKRWHMAALSQGSLGLDDLEAELAVL
ncbi:DUF885 domain-containing protein [Streptomyces sp. NBC_01304]|uniref:DUF885 domain-containing protein n=1 Tax=Streptomyces sp. NBC_01304 TaxID=2903818 RepID=UPI002E1127D1|nr:DUF885 domain-containing protein [Streptomyces sp. NBC_01304]